LGLLFYSKHKKEDETEREVKLGTVLSKAQRGGISRRGMRSFVLCYSKSTRRWLRRRGRSNLGVL